MNRHEMRFRQMLRTGTVIRNGDKFVRRTYRVDWTEAFCKLVKSLGGQTVTDNDAIIATLPPEVFEVVTADKPWRGGRKPTGRQREQWGSTFDPTTRPLAEAMGKNSGLAWNVIVDKAVKEKAKREGLV